MLIRRQNPVIETRACEACAYITTYIRRRSRWGVEAESLAPFSAERELPYSLRLRTADFRWASCVDSVIVVMLCVTRDCV